MATAVAKRYTPAPGEGAAERGIVAVLNSSWPVLEAAASTEQAKAMIAARNAAGLVNQLPWDDFIEHLGQATVPMARHINQTVTAAVKDLEGAAAKLSFANQDVVSIKYAQQQGSKMIRNITDSQRAATRATISRALQGDYTVDQAAAMIRRSIGLHPAWNDAVMKFHANQFERFRREGMPSGKAMQRADAAANRYRDRLVKRRAMNIARTEIQTASNLGRYATWAQMIGSGVARPDSRKEWAAGPGACEICHSLAGQNVQWDHMFSNGSPMPPAHPGCRCTAVLIPTRYKDTALDAREIDWTSPVLSRPDEFTPKLDLPEADLSMYSSPAPAMSDEDVRQAVKFISRGDMTLSDYAELPVDVYNAAKGVRTWTQGQDGMDQIKAGGDVADAFHAVLSAAPRTDTVLYRGIVVDDPAAFAKLNPGDEIPVHTASSFTSSRNMVENYLYYDEDEDQLTGVLLKLTGGKALPVGKLGGSGLESEWITNTAMTVSKVEQLGDGLWQITVTQ